MGGKKDNTRDAGREECNGVIRRSQGRSEGEGKGVERE